MLWNNLENQITRDNAATYSLMQALCLECVYNLIYLDLIYLAPKKLPEVIS